MGCSCLQGTHTHSPSPDVAAGSWAHCCSDGAIWLSLNIWEMLSNKRRGLAVYVPSPLLFGKTIVSASGKCLMESLSTSVAWVRNNRLATRIQWPESVVTRRCFAWSGQAEVFKNTQHIEILFCIDEQSEFQRGAITISKWSGQWCLVLVWKVPVLSLWDMNKGEVLSFSFQTPKIIL